MTANPFARLKRDGNEAGVVTYLRMHGFVVAQIHGQGVPDLLVYGAKCGFGLLEVKSAKGRITEAQRRAFAVWEGERAQFAIVRDHEQALAAVRSWEGKAGQARHG